MVERRIRIPKFVRDNLVNFILLGIILFVIFTVTFLHWFESFILYISINIAYITIFYLIGLLFVSLFLLEIKKKLYLKRALILMTEIFIGILAIAFLPHLLATFTSYDYSATFTVKLGYSFFNPYPYVTGIELDSIQNIPLSGNFVFNFNTPEIVVVKAYCPSLVSTGVGVIQSDSFYNPFPNNVTVTVPGLSKGQVCNFVAYVEGNSPPVVELAGVKI